MVQLPQTKQKTGVAKAIMVLVVFAVTGFTTAYLARTIPTWVGFTELTPWYLKLSLRLAVLIFGYQAILLVVAFLLGQFSYFWQFERRLLQRLRILGPPPVTEPLTKPTAP